MKHLKIKFNKDNSISIPKEMGNDFANILKKLCVNEKIRYVDELKNYNRIYFETKKGK